VKHYCHVCGTRINEKEIQNNEGKKYYCSRHRELSTPNVLLMDGQPFKTVFKTIERILRKDGISELTFQIGRDGLRFQYIDPAHTSLTELHLYTKAFRALNIDFPTPKTFTISVDELIKILRKVEKNVEVLIRFNENHIQLSLQEKNFSRNTQKRAFSLKSLNTSREDVPEPELKFQALISIKASTLIRVLEKIKESAHYENTYFECNPNHFQIYASDDYNNKVSESFNKTQLLNIDTEKEVIGVYNSNHILTLIKGLEKYINTIQIHYSHNMLVLLTANLINSGHVKFYLAPCIQDF